MTEPKTIDNVILKEGIPVPDKFLTEKEENAIDKTAKRRGIKNGFCGLFFVEDHEYEPPDRHLDCVGVEGCKISHEEIRPKSR